MTSRGGDKESWRGRLRGGGGGGGGDEEVEITILG